VNFISSRWVIGTFVGTALGLASVAPAAAAAKPAPAPIIVNATVALPQATQDRSTLYASPTTSLTTTGGVPFSLGKAYHLYYGTAPSASLTVNFDKPQAVYLLLNTSWTDASFAGQTVGTVHLTFSDGTFRDTALVVGANIREFLTSAIWTVNTLSSPATVSVWQGPFVQGGAAATMDMLTIPVTSTARLTGVTVSDTNNSHMSIIFQGLTVAYDPVAPKPTKEGTGTHSGGTEQHETAGHHDGHEHQGDTEKTHDGHEPDGHEPDGHEPDGHEPDGHKD
jgi:hypothetical protein